MLREARLRAFALTVLIVLVEVAAASFNQFTITQAGSNYILAQNGVDISSDALTLGGGSYSTANNQANWLQNPVSLAATTLLPSNLQSQATFLNSSANVAASNGPIVLSKVADHPDYEIYQAHYSNNVPFMTEFGSVRPSSSVSQGFSCDTNTKHSRRTIECRSLNTSLGYPLFSFRMELPGVYPETVSSVSITNNATTEIPPAKLQRIAITMATYHLVATSSLEISIASMKTANDNRVQNNRNFVGALWFFVAVLAIAQAGVFIIVQTWCCPLTPRKYLIPVWSAIAFGFLLLVSLTAGLLGWIFVGMFFVLYSCFACCCYCCMKRKVGAPVENIELHTSASGEHIELAVTEEKGSDPPRIFNDTSEFTRRPEKISKSQIRVICWFVGTWILFMFLFLSVFFPWDVHQYSVFDRSTDQQVTEYQPSVIAKGVASVYSYDHMASNLKLQPLFDWATDYCGNLYHDTLHTNEQKDERINQAFIEKYNVDMSLFVKESYLQYSSVNEWFIRHIKSSVRPISSPTDSNIVVSPADARVIAFQNVPSDQRVWIKGSSFNIPELLGSDDHVLSTDYSLASMMLVRLAPQDYHRYHSPITGNITKQYYVNGGLHSVNADAMTTGNYAIYNQRAVTIIDSHEFGEVGFVAIGAVCVGSVVMTKTPGDSVTKGDELGYFQFGGSTLALIFPASNGASRIKFADDIMAHSIQATEVLVEMGMRVGVRA